MAYVVLLVVGSCASQFPVNGTFDEVRDFCRRNVAPNYVWLRFAKDDNVAILADWERVRRNANSERFGRDVDPFVRLIESRLGITVPRWWRRILRKGKLEDGQARFFSIPYDAKMWNRANGWRFSGFDGISFDATGLHVFQHGETIHIPRRLAQYILVIDDTPKDTAYIGQIGEREVLIAAHGLYCTLDGPSTLTSLRKTDLSIKWEADIDTGFHGGIGGGLPGGSYSSVTFEGERVVLFGGHAYAMYFHVLSRRDGRILVRFATSYLDRSDGLRKKMPRE